MRKTFALFVIASILVGGAPVLGAGTDLPYREITTQRHGPGTDYEKWRRFVTSRPELRRIWQRFNLRGDLPNIGFERRVAVIGGTGGSSSCPLELRALRLNRAERQITMRFRADTGGQNACTSDWVPYTSVASVKRELLPHGDLTVRVRQVYR